MSGATLYTVVPAKLLHDPERAVLCCDLSAISPAPFGNLVRVCFDIDDDRAGRDAALEIGHTFLPLREGLRHFVIADGDRTFIVGLCPDEDGHDDIVISKLCQVRPFPFSRDGVLRQHLGDHGNGRLRGQIWKDTQ